MVTKTLPQIGIEALELLLELEFESEGLFCLVCSGRKPDVGCLPEDEGHEDGCRWGDIVERYKIFKKVRDNAASKH